MEVAKFQLGSMVSSAAPTRLPPGRSDSMRNLDFPEGGAVTRRPGFKRYLSSALSGKLSLLAGIDNYDGTREFVVIDDSGVGTT